MFKMLIFQRRSSDYSFMLVFLSCYCVVVVVFCDSQSVAFMPCKQLCRYGRLCRDSPWFVSGFTIRLYTTALQTDCTDGARL